MALQLAANLETEHKKIRRNADNPALLLESFISVTTCIGPYFYEAERTPQSNKVRESMAEFGWRWIELPNVPLRKLLPSTANTLKRFPECKGLVLVIADLLLDIFKQNVLAKMEAMRAGVLQGLFLAAGHLALSDSFSGDDFLLAGRIFEALRKMLEPPSIQFYSRTRETKDRFYGLERRAWGEINLGAVLKDLEERGELENSAGPPAANHGLLLTLHFLRKHSNEQTMEHYLQVIKNMGEAFENTFPGTAGNAPFNKFLKETLEGARGPNLPRAIFDSGDVSDLLEETLLILKRTLNPSQVPWDHRTPCLLPSLNDLYQRVSNVEGMPLSLEVLPRHSPGQTLHGSRCSSSLPDSKCEQQQNRHFEPRKRRLTRKRYFEGG